MIQIDLPMPEACDVCPLNYDFCWCKGFKNNEFDKWSEDWNAQVCEGEHRPEYCPLKEQEAIKPKEIAYAWRCGKCDEYLTAIQNHRIRYCPYCGQAVKWE